MKIVTVFRLILFLICAAIFLVVPSIIAYPLSEQWRRKVMMYPWWGFGYALRWVFGVRFKIEGREFTGGKYEFKHLFICNHLSVADIPLLVSVYPLPFVAKREMLRVPIINLAAMAAGAVVFDRSDPHARRMALEETLRRIKEVNSIYIFPEGTRSRNGIPKAEPHPNSMRAAWENKIDVVPMALYGSQHILHQLWTDVTIKISEPIHCADFSDRDQFARACWNRVLDMYYEMDAKAKAQAPQSEQVTVYSPEITSTSPGLDGVFERVASDIQEKPSTSE